MNRVVLAVSFLAVGFFLGFYLGDRFGAGRGAREPGRGAREPGRAGDGGEKREEAFVPDTGKERGPGASRADLQWLKNAIVGPAPTRGGEQAEVTIIEFSDFNCRYCAGMAGVLDRVWSSYGDRVRIIFKHSPFPGHPLALEAHKASVAAFQQGRFWEMQTLLFANQETLDSRSLRGHANTLGLNMEQFEDDLESAEVAGIVERDIAQAKAADVNRVPTLFLNGMRLQGGFTYELLVARIEKELGRAK